MQTNIQADARDQIVGVGIDGAGGNVLIPGVVWREDLLPMNELTVTKAIKASDTPEKQAEAAARLKRVKVIMARDQPDGLVIHSEVPFRKDLELKYKIKVPRQSTLFIKHDIGDVEVSNIVGNLNVTARIGDVTIRLPASEEFNVDARAKIGDVSSEFGGKNSRQWLIGAKANQATDYKETAHWVIARIGIGDIEVRKMK